MTGNVVLRRKRLSTSWESCLMSAVKIIINITEKSGNKGSYSLMKRVQDIPCDYASRYMQEIGLYQWNWSCSYLRSTFHPLCTCINFEHSSLSGPMWRQLFTHLDAMPLLQEFVMGQAPKVVEDYNLDSHLFLHHLPQLRYLRKVKLHIAAVPEVLVHIGKYCPGLEQLHLSRCPCTFSWWYFQVLKCCQKLHTLHLHFCSVSDMDVIQIMEAFPKVVSLNIRSDKGNQPMDSLLQTCSKPYHLQNIYRVLQDSNLQDRLVATFPNLTTLSIRQCVDISLAPLNRLKCLTRLGLEDVAPERLLEVRNFCMPRLTVLFIKQCPSINNVLHRDLDLTFPLMSSFTLHACHDVDLPVMSLLFPNLEEFEVVSCTYSPLIPIGSPDESIFPYLKELTILKSEALTFQHLRHILTSCRDIAKLVIHGCDYLDNMNLLELLDVNPMKNLHALSLKSPRLSRDTEDIINDVKYFGDNLCHVDLYGEQLSQAAPIVTDERGAVSESSLNEDGKPTPYDDMLPPCDDILPPYDDMFPPYDMLPPCDDMLPPYDLR